MFAAQNCPPTGTAGMVEPNIDVLFVGKTGVGKSSLINMIRGIPDHATSAAEVSNDARPCTLKTTAYPASLEPGMQCQLWDTRGLDEATETHGGFMARVVDWIHQRSQQARELKETLHERTKRAVPILMWCIDAAKIDVSVPWEQFCRVYVEYCQSRAIPVVVITRMPPRLEAEWKKKCNEQLAKLGSRGNPNGVGVSLIRVRNYQHTTSPEYNEDSKALRDLISDLMKR